MGLQLVGIFCNELPKMQTHNNWIFNAKLYGNGSIFITKAKCAYNFRYVFYIALMQDYHVATAEKNS